MMENSISEHDAKIIATLKGKLFLAEIKTIGYVKFPGSEKGFSKMWPIVDADFKEHEKKICEPKCDVCRDEAFRSIIETAR